MLAGLRAAGAEVVECRMEMQFTGHGKRAVASRPLAWPGAFARWAHARRRFRRLVAAAIEEHRPDALFVPYPAHPIVPEVRRVFAGPLIADLFLSAHETLVEDRRRFRPGSLAARVVPFKVVHALAEGRPVLTADTPVVRALLQPGRDCMVCAPGDPSALACALTLAHGDAARLADIARCGRAAYEHGFSIASVGARLALELARAGVRLSAPEEARHGEPPALAVPAAPEARG